MSVVQPKSMWMDRSNLFISSEKGTGEKASSEPGRQPHEPWSFSVCSS